MLKTQTLNFTSLLLDAQKKKKPLTLQAWSQTMYMYNILPWTLNTNTNTYAAWTTALSVMYTLLHQNIYVYNILSQLPKPIPLSLSLTYIASCV